MMKTEPSDREKGNGAQPPRRSMHLPYSPRRSSIITEQQQPPRSPVHTLTHSHSMRVVASELVDDEVPASVRRVSRHLMGASRMRSRCSVVDPRTSDDVIVKPKALLDDDELASLLLQDEEDASGSTPLYGSLFVSGEADEDGQPTGRSAQQRLELPKMDHSSSPTSSSASTVWLVTLINQLPAIAVAALLNMMLGIPFGASYFPIGWKEGGVVDNNTEEEDGENDVDGLFPLAGKQAMGLRMFMFATFISQLTFTFASRFENAVGLQMVENVPFLHALCKTVIARQGYGKEALSTVFFLFGLSSVMVGSVFYLLGKWQLGRIVYFFPSHVLVGCIGGIGVFLVVTAIEVSNNVTFTFDMDGIVGVWDNFNLFGVVVLFEAILRLLQWMTQDKQGNPKYPLLSPVYYCMITPIFYISLKVLGVSLEAATEMGYFFPAPASSAENAATSLWSDPHLFDIFSVIDFSTISWSAVSDSVGTMVALSAFSLIHVPINIPAFAISTDVDTDMNAELMAHGYANALSGLFGGLQNYMTYSNSVLYAKSGGAGKVSSITIALATAVLFVIGPFICSYLPRCMAGTLLLHIGIDLLLEGVFDSYGDYDVIEYAGIWLITLAMTIWGMTAALITGVISALSTYAVQSINYQNPVRQILTASTLRSSAWARCASARAILDSEKTGRSSILIFQLQGHIFFGNVAQLTDTIKETLKEKNADGKPPVVVIVDFTLVVGMDSSAAHAIAKLKKIIHRLFHVEVSIFVTGSGRGGFPCEYALSKALCPEAASEVREAGVDWNDVPSKDSKPDIHSSPRVQRGSISVSPGTASIKASKKLNPVVDGTVCESLDEALKFAEDLLIMRENPSIETSVRCDSTGDIGGWDMSLQEEKFIAHKFLKEILPPSREIDQSIEILFNMMVRESYAKEEVLWDQGAESDSVKLLVRGELVSVIEDTGASEIVTRGNVVGELGLIHGIPRLTTLVCSAEESVLYTLSKESWGNLMDKHPHIAMLIQEIAIRYLAHRVQHVSNRYFHTTLPV